MIFALNPPPIQALGNASGFTFKLQDRDGHGNDGADRARATSCSGWPRKSPMLAGVRPEGHGGCAAAARADRSRPGARARPVDRRRQRHALDRLRLGLRQRLQPRGPRAARAAAGRCAVPHDAGRRAQPARAQRQRRDGAVRRLHHRRAGPPARRSSSATTAIRPRPSRARPRPAIRPARRWTRWSGSPASCPPGFAFEWTGTSFEEKQSAGQIGALLGLSLVVVFLLLAALYESWTVPLAVLLVVPLGVLGAVLFTMLRGLSADVYFNVGLITIIGLAAKNAILIVEFAIEREAEGESVLRRDDGGGEAAAAPDHHDHRSPSSSAWCRWSSPAARARPAAARSAPA